jgi:hypothetical protein
VAPSTSRVHDGADEAAAVREVEGDDVEGVGVDLDERRGLADPGVLALPDLGHDPVGRELVDEHRDRGAGEAGLAGEVRAAHRAAAEQGLQHHRAVVHPVVLRERLAAGAPGAGADGAGRCGGQFGGHVRRLHPSVVIDCLER